MLQRKKVLHLSLFTYFLFSEMDMIFYVYFFKYVKYIRIFNTVYKTLLLIKSFIHLGHPSVVTAGRVVSERCLSRIGDSWNLEEFDLLKMRNFMLSYYLSYISYVNISRILCNFVTIDEII